jgi:hypothetical protein
MRTLAALVIALGIVGAPQDTPASLAEALRALAARLEALTSAPAGCVAAGRLQAALSAAAPGSAVAACPGVRHVGGLRVPDGVRLTSSGPGLTRAERAEIVLTASQSIVLGSNTRLDHIVTTGNATEHISCGVIDGQTTREQQPTNVQIDHNIIDGAAGGRRGIGAHCRNGVIEDNEIINFALVGQDTQCIFGSNGEGPIIIRRNLLRCAGENIMFGGDDPRIPGLVPSDILIEDNRLTKDLAWRGTPITAKNLFELKAARRVIVRRNDFGFTWQGSQAGFAFQFTVQSQGGGNPNVIVEEVLIEHNVIHDVGCGVNIIGYAQINASLQSRAFTFRNNWWQIDGVTYGCHGIYMQLGREPREITIENETIQMVGASATNPDAKGNQIVSMTGNPIHAFRFVGNLVPRSGLYGFSGNGAHRGDNLATYLPGATISGNALGSFPRVSNLPGNLHMSTTAMAPLVVDGYGTGAVEAYGRRRP